MSIYLDIETTGLSHKTDRISLVGVMDTSDGYFRLTQYSDLDEVIMHLSAIPDGELVITYNGISFDWKFLHDQLNIPLPKRHLDLMEVSKSLLIEPNSPYKYISMEKACHQMGIDTTHNSSGKFMALLGKVGGSVAMSEIAYHNSTDLHDLFCLHNQFRKYFGDEVIDGYIQKPKVYNEC